MIIQEQDDRAWQELGGEQEQLAERALNRYRELGATPAEVAELAIGLGVKMEICDDH